MQLIDTELQLKLHLIGTLVVPVALCWLLVLADVISVRFGARARQRRGLPSLVMPEDGNMARERAGVVRTRIS